MTWPSVPRHRVPVVDSESMRRADAAAQDYGIQPVQLMEAAGIQLARFVDRWSGGARGKQVAVVSGPGNNGGDALVAARHLLQRGASLEIWFMPATGEAGALAAQHLMAAQRLGIPCRDATTGAPVLAGDLVLDGLFGIGIRLPIRGPAARIIAAMNASALPKLAVDIPSGLHADTGEGADQCVRAAATLTLGVAKPALLKVGPTGRLFIADIGLPAILFGLSAEAVRDLYREGDLLEVQEPSAAPN